MRRLLCRFIYWMIEPLLDALDQRKWNQKYQVHEMQQEGFDEDAIWVIQNGRFVEVKRSCR